MSVRSVGWTVSLGVLGVGLLVAAAGAARNAEARRRTTESARHLKNQWTQAAEGVRTRAIDTAEDWREKSAENIERAVSQAAEARDDALDALPDDDDAEGARPGEGDRRS